MHTFLRSVTDLVTTKKGAWITLAIWIVVAAILSITAPSSKDYSVNNVTTLYPETSPSEIAQQKIDQHFKEDEGMPAILVFKTKESHLNLDELLEVTEEIFNTEIPYVKSVIPLHLMPPEATASFISEDNQAAFLPILFEEDMTSKEINVGLDEIYPIVHANPTLQMFVTGPAGIAVDATELFSRADLVLLFSTIGIILVLLIFTYRSPLLALIPLFAAIFVYAVADRLLGLLGLSGIELASQSLSIMMILLFAVVIDYSLFIFSRFREELRKYEDKYEAMRLSMRELGIPIFYSGSTILLAMLVLFAANFGDYKNFAPIFSIAVLVVMLSSITLIPTLFTLFGRRSFWPKIPRVGDEVIRTSSLWSKVGRTVSTRPILSVVLILGFLLITSSNIFTITYEYNTMKSFPDDMPSRIGYDILEDKFSKGTLAPTTVILESNEQVTEEKQQEIASLLNDQEIVHSVRVSNRTEDDQIIQFDLTFKEDPYDVQTIDALENMMKEGNEFLAKAEVKGEFYFAGETAASVDNRNVNNRDLIVIVIAETILIFTMLIFLTRSVSISTLMMGTILLSFLAALGLGTFLSGYIFDVHSISNRVPVYAFVFLVALGIDYNIFLVSRFLEEKKHHPVKDAVARAVAHTGGVISSAGIILAATFAVLITQPVEVLYIFGFIVAIGILMDTFLIRGILLPGLLVLLEKNEHIRLIKRNK
ncbi:MMPL family transporter [Pseudogracilibacillus auburnensis]|uniref:RND superfamily putative drug exporter n=1 Tax=Pseudogracilibacillus auburnensis TaxID=1494959 RepID=A0A2V3VUM0_9BACI|nr:MMPL family transporter [Pseudogracilibacillus auburnensis]PXW85607.1 RND superfamily putative drug exporter [Pseudogracilibacillus auburnensis]